VSRDQFFDTNVLVYAHTSGDYRSEIARELLLDGGVVGVQALNEFALVARAKLGFNWPRVRAAVGNILIFCPNPRPLRVETHLRALEISERYGFSIWDGLIVAAAIEARCSVLLSEDMQHGQVVEGVRIENPFLGRTAPEVTRRSN
jgi:predicted nucleic acid-binding protein